MSSIFSIQAYPMIVCDCLVDLEFVYPCLVSQAYPRAIHHRTMVRSHSLQDHLSGHRRHREGRCEMAQGCEEWRRICQKLK